MPKFPHIFSRKEKTTIAAAVFVVMLTFCVFVYATPGDVRLGLNPAQFTGDISVSGKGTFDSVEQTYPAGGYDYLVYTYLSGSTRYYAARHSNGTIINSWTSSNASSVINNAVSGLTSGRTTLETVRLTGNITLTSGIDLSTANHTKLCGPATLNKEVNGNFTMIYSADTQVDDIEICDLTLFGNHLDNGSGDIINFTQPTQTYGAFKSIRQLSIHNVAAKYANRNYYCFAFNKICYDAYNIDAAVDPTGGGAWYAVTTSSVLSDYKLYGGCNFALYVQGATNNVFNGFASGNGGNSSYVVQFYGGWYDKIVGLYIYDAYNTGFLVRDAFDFKASSWTVAKAGQQTNNTYYYGYLWDVQLSSFNGVTFTRHASEANLPKYGFYISNSTQQAETNTFTDVRVNSCSGWYYDYATNTVATGSSGWRAADNATNIMDFRNITPS